jgi:hypothetical protein
MIARIWHGKTKASDAKVVGDPEVGQKKRASSNLADLYRQVGIAPVFRK